MRDIRNDLKERLAAIASRYREEMAEFDRKLEELQRTHKETIGALDRERATLTQLLEIEDRRAGTPISPAKQPVRLVPLHDFLLTKVHAHGPLSRDELKAEASLAGYFEESDGRTFHITLMNITKSGKINQLPDGRYVFPKRETSPLFGMDESKREDEMKILM